MGSAPTLLSVIVSDSRAEQVEPLATAWALARVTGPSMTPTVRHGDRLLIVTTSGSHRATEQRILALSQHGRLAGWPSSGIERARRIGRQTPRKT